MKIQLYQKCFQKFQVEVIEVPEDIQGQIQKSIFSFKYEGITEENVSLMVDSARRLIEEGAAALIMGCTEIPTILQGQRFSVPIIDPNDVIAMVAVRFAKNRPTE